MTDRLFSFIGGAGGAWLVQRQLTVAGNALPLVQCLDIRTGVCGPSAPGWVLRGITSNERYVERAERDLLVARQQGLGRPEATQAALIPIRKSAAWWSLTQDARRDILEGQSRHIQIGLKYLPPIARRLHHCRDISESEPFDFLTWFEFSPAHEQAFDDLLAELRASVEWTYVNREIDIRLIRATT